MIYVRGGNSRIQDNFPGERLTANLEPLFMETKANFIYREGQKDEFFSAKGEKQRKIIGIR